MNTHYTTAQIDSMTQQQVEAALMEDFLERNGDTYVRIRRSGRLGWEETLPKGTAYSHRMLSPKNDDELLSIAYRHADSMIKAMNTPYKVKLCVNGNKSWTDSQQLHVASSCLEDQSMSIGQRLDVFTGYAVHEGSHLLYSDFKCQRSYIQAVNFLQNILEDEMIEIKLGEEKPGFANFLTAAKYHAFGRYEDDMQNENVTGNKLVDMINAILAMVRYPKSLSHQMVLENGRLLLKIRQMLVPYPDNTQKCIDTAQRIYDLLLEEYLKDEQPEQNQDQDQDQSNGGQGDQNQSSQQSSDSQQDSESNTNDKQSQGGQQEDTQSSSDHDNSSTSDDNDSGNASQPSQQGADADSLPSDSSRTGNASGKSASAQDRRQAQQQLEDDFEQIRKALENLFNQPNARPDKNEIAKGFKKDDGLLAKECQGELKRGNTDRCAIISAKNDRQNYSSVVRKVRKYIPSVSSILRSNGTDYKMTLKGLRSGNLDTGKLAEAFQGVQSVYMRKAEVKADKMTVALLVDESGSMGGEKLVAMQQTAVLFNEALRNIPNVKTYIYGYTGNGTITEMYKYVEPGNNKGYGLGTMSNRWYTPTAKAIQEMTSILTNEQDENTLLIIVSDGEPDTSEQDVANQVKKAQKRGISILGISIDDDLPESKLKLMYNRYIRFHDMSQLVKDLGKVLKKEVLAKTQRRCSA